MFSRHYIRCRIRKLENGNEKISQFGFIECVNSWMDEIYTEKREFCLIIENINFPCTTWSKEIYKVFSLGSLFIEKSILAMNRTKGFHDSPFSEYFYYHLFSWNRSSPNRSMTAQVNGYINTIKGTFIILIII